MGLWGDRAGTLLAAPWGCSGAWDGGMWVQEGAGMLQGDANKEDKGNILRGCNVNRAGAEPLFMESLSCQGICQGPDLRSYLDKGARGGEQSWRQSHRTPGAAAHSLGADKEVAEGPGPKPQLPSQKWGWMQSLGLGCWGSQRPGITSLPTRSIGPLSIAWP